MSDKYIGVESRNPYQKRSIMIPRKLAKMISQFDRAKEMIPITFELDLEISEVTS